MRDDPKLLILSVADNVAIARNRLKAGDIVAVSGVRVNISDEIPLGHKLARCPIAAGEKIIKLGAPIGYATEAIALGAHVHTHNIASDYIPTYTLPEDSP
ncbi:MULTISPECIES: UxaA family hydrolase [unclassified Mesorhizobium]|uniref:UxaA family hydrolase n=1 Tax=unclassified Mesorhizobium TaxID=325217 RepID=UPI000FD86846|nr:MULTISPECIES: UxaA family hydrolase [unclassified Mesorhizobium]RWE22649.1 MAG: hydrolase [Mesorhizobium sp.]TGQ19110.1 hydrolase [Mesorhizobium sp. M00.F.Ca.ET.217.01.1.1]TGV89999.1 hydrolase [Mesorhizobium sp. M00.F.Ca.ET.158.01.1.1]TIW20417.1 MAG: hydrolase [Mesorhizobium sp.]